METGRLAFVWPTLVGSYLRLYQLPQQMLVDDEWHMVHKLRSGAPFASVVGDFGNNDHSIGLSVCNWLVMHVTTVDELILRMPSVVAGLVLLVLIPALLRPLLGRGTAIVVAWLLAVSPMLCFFTRLARPYAITTLLVCIATLSFHSWVIRGGGRRAAWSYAVSAALAPIFHLPALPAVLAPVGLLILVRIYPPPGRLASSRTIAGLLLVTLLLMTALLIFPLVSSGTQIFARLDADQLRLETIPGTVELLTGTSRWPAILIVWLLGSIGLAALWRRSKLLVSYFLLVIAVQIASIAGSGAAAIHAPIVAARYMAVVLPLLLIFPAAGLTAAAAKLDRLQRYLLPTALGASVAVFLWWVGPLRWIYRSPNNFTNHVSYQADYREGRYFERFRPNLVSPFYTDILGRLEPGSITIVEAPWYFYFHSFAYYQRIHHQHVLIGFVNGTSAAPRIGEVSLNDRRITLRNAIDLADTSGLRARGVQLVVLHRDLFSETRWPTGVTDVAIDMSPWIERYQHSFGPPVFEDSQIVAFSVQPAGIPAAARASDDSTH